LPHVKLSRKFESRCSEVKTLSSRHLRFLVFRHFGYLYVAAAICWVVVSVLYFKQPAAKREMPMDWLIIAIGATAICLIYGAYKIRRAVYLFHHGIEVEGVVSSFGLRARGLVRVNFSYQVGETTYTMASSEAVMLYDVGDKIALVVDPKRPTVCAKKGDIYPDHREPSLDNKPDSWKWWYYILAGIVFAVAAMYGCINPDFLKPRDGAHGLANDLYDVVGGSGFIGLIAALSLGCFWMGILKFRKRR
jgi:hypothetical protein